jgi:hypothetical protein
MGEEEDKTQIQPYAREKKWKQRSFFLVWWKKYISSSEMVQVKREQNRRVLQESGLLDTTKQLNALVAKQKSPEVHYSAKAASSDSGIDTDTEKEGSAIMTPSSMARPRHKNIK